jgi:branched-chain amino acid transport system ATP-binding protein
MIEILGSNIAVFFCLTLLLMGFVSYMAGQALATTWRPWWLGIPYGFMLGAADRFLTWALFKGPLAGLVPYLIASAIMLVYCLGAYRLTQARRMVAQYPWLYERTGPFGWRSKGG